MTQTPTAQAPAQAWRGIAAEDVDDLPGSLASLLRRRARSLLQDLLRPHRARVALILLLIVIANIGLGPRALHLRAGHLPAGLRH